MTLAFDDRYKLYQPVVSTTNFNVDFPVFAVADLEVRVAGVVTTLFTVTATFVDGRSDNAVIILNSAVSSGDVEIYGKRQPRRENSYLAGDPKLSENLQRDIEATTAVQQEQNRDFGRSIRLPAGETTTTEITDNAATRASKFVGFDASGNVIVGTGLGSTPVSAFGVTLVDDADADAVRGTIGIQSFVVTAGTAPNFTITSPSPVTALVEGMLWLVQFHDAVGSPTPDMAIDGLAAVPLKRLDQFGAKVVPQSGSVQGGQVVWLVIKGGDAVIMSPTGDSITPGPVKVVTAALSSPGHSGWPPAESRVVEYVNQRLGAPAFVLEDQKTSGTDGGTATSGSWEKRDLNTEVRDPNNLVSITAEEFTPTVAGWVEWSAPAHDCTQHQTRLYNVTDAVVAGVGSSEWSGTAGNSTTRSEGGAPVLANKVYRIEHQVTTTVTTTGHGRADGFGTEVYTRVKFWRT